MSEASLAIMIDDRMDPPVAVGSFSAGVAGRRSVHDFDAFYEQGIRLFIVDVTQVTVLPSAWTSVHISLAKSVRDLRPGLALVGVERRIQGVLTPRWGQLGRCHLRPWSDIVIVQVVKHRVEGHLSIVRRIVQGTTHQVTELLQASQKGGKINTAFIERLNATFRQRLAWLARRSRNLARQPETLQAGMFIVGCIYNFCTYHDSLRVAFYLAKGGQRWLQRTPAIAAGLTDHLWTIEELFNFKVPPPRWTPPKRRGPMPKQTAELVKQWCN